MACEQLQRSNRIERLRFVQLVVRFVRSVVCVSKAAPSSRELALLKKQLAMCDIDAYSQQRSGNQ